MKRSALVAIAALGACQSEPRTMPLHPPVATPAPTPPKAVPAPAPPPAPAPAPPPPSFTRVEAPPGGTIRWLAVTPTEDAALTIDDTNQVRLWPTLDGSRAPVAVDLPWAHAIALVHPGDGFAAFLAIDGGSIVVSIDTDGHVRGHVELGVFDAVTAVGDGFVASRGTVRTAFDAAGTARGPGTLPPRSKPQITAKASDLVIATASGPRYLGYAFPANDLWRAGDVDHVVVPGAGNRCLQLDGTLAPVRELLPWTPRHDQMTGLTWLGGDDWLVASASGLSLWTAGAATGMLALPSAKLQGYDRDSHLILLAGKRLARYVPDRHAIEPVGFTAWGAGTSTYLVSPKLANGALLVQTTLTRDLAGNSHLAMRWIHDLSHPDRGATSAQLDGYFEAGHDPAGHVFAGADDQGGVGGVLSVVADGKPLDSIPARSIDPSPDGTRYLERLDDGSVRLVDLDHRVAWTKRFPDGDPTWLDAGHLLISRGEGVASVAVTSGELSPFHSGWGFERDTRPHLASFLARPLALVHAQVRDAPIVLAADAAFQKLARAVAQRSGCDVLWWGPVTLDGAATRVALLKVPGETGSPLFGYLIEAGAGSAFTIAIQAWGVSEFQDPITEDPPWGIEREPEYGLRIAHTIDRTSLPVSSKWIHGSFEHVELAMHHGEVVVVEDSWMDRDNNGHGYDITSDSKTYKRNPPKLATYKLFAMQTAISQVATDADTLAAIIHEIHRPL